MIESAGIPLPRRERHSELLEATKKLHAYFTRRVANRSDIEDCVVEALTLYWQYTRAVNDEEELADQALYVRARGVLNNYYRATSRRHRLIARYETFQDHKVAEDLDLQQDIRRALDELSERDRELVLLVVWDQVPIKEAAGVLGIKASTARVRYLRARARLREELGVFAPIN